MYKPGQKVRLIKPVYARAPIPVAGTVGEIIENPNPWSERGSQFIWVRFSKKVRHGVTWKGECQTPFGMRDIDGSIWLLNECDFNDEDRAYVRVGLDPDNIELATEENRFAGYEDALIEAWKAELDRARGAREEAYKEYRMEFDRLMDAKEFDAAMALMDAQENGPRNVADFVVWDNCLKSVGLL